MTAFRLRLLLVDDEPPIRKLLRMGLTAQGYQVLEAPNGKAALDLLDLPANRYPHGAAAKADEGSTA
jgi:CheY-like chemotaxis protein